MFNLIKTALHIPPVNTEALELVNEFASQHIDNYQFDLKNFTAGVKYQNSVPRLKCEVIIEITKWLDNNPRIQNTSMFFNQADWRERWKMGEILSQQLRQKLPFTEDEVLYLVHWVTNDNGEYISHGKVPQIIKTVENHLKDHEMNEELRRAIGSLVKFITSQQVTAETRRWILRLNELTGNTEIVLPLQAGDIWANAALAELGPLDLPVKAAWADLLSHCLNASGSSPTGRWLNTADKYLNVIGMPSFTTSVIRWFSVADQPRVVQVTHYDNLQTFLDVNSNILKGLIWLCVKTNSPEIPQALTNLSISCYRKIPGTGPRAAKIGNACFWALANLSNAEGVAQLSLLKTRIKMTSAQKVITSALDTAAKRTGVSASEIEEMSVPVYGLQDIGVRRDDFGEAASEINIKNSDAEQVWIRKDGKILSSAPKAIKDKHSQALKEITQALKDIRKMLTVQRDRIDNLYLSQRKWEFDTWLSRYINHPLVGTIARRIIWKFSRDGKTISAIHVDGKFIDRMNNRIDWLDGSTTVELWHPIDEDVQTVLEWRQWLLDHEVQQPFKQAYREVYLLTDAERNTHVYSNRYAAHVLRQHQFNSLCAIRGWKNSLRLMVDSEYPPARKELPQWGLRAEYWIEGIGDHTNATGTFLYLATDQVRFYRIDSSENRAHAGGGGYVNERRNANALAEPIALDQIPPLVLSEIMRDVDMFVGVASIGNDPNWLDGGPQVRYREYWHGYSFGDLTESAKTRKQFLENLIPRLKIAGRCTINEKFLVVRGDLRSYKIHLGSGNILMEPNDQYLCIVPSRSSSGNDPRENLFVPFEGDQTLSIILSKAFLLADDKSIKDPTITRQLKL
jgi:hypothetical protein